MFQGDVIIPIKKASQALLPFFFPENFFFSNYSATKARSHKEFYVILLMPLHSNQFIRGAGFQPRKFISRLEAAPTTDITFKFPITRFDFLCLRV